MFGLTKAYYAWLKPLLCPELKEREIRSESQGQQAAELEDRQLQKEKFQGREFQESQDSQGHEVRDQMTISSDDKNHGVKDQSLESQHVRDLSPEPQDFGKHHLKGQTQTPRDNRKYKEETRA